MNLFNEPLRLKRRSSGQPRWGGSAGREGISRRLTFSPAAWLKLLCFLHAGDFEVGGFGVSAARDPLYVEDFATVAQEVNTVSVSFDDTAVADYFERCVDQGLKPERFARIWIHTHPGSSPQPSGTDEATFHRVFGRCDWSVMFILGRTHRTYARLNLTTGPGAQVPLEVEVDWAAWPNEVRHVGGNGIFNHWMEEFRRNIVPRPIMAELDLPEAGPAEATRAQATLAQTSLEDWEQQAWALELAALDLPPCGAGFARFAGAGATGAGAPNDVRPAPPRPAQTLRVPVGSGETSPPGTLPPAA